MELPRTPVKIHTMVSNALNCALMKEACSRFHAIFTLNPGRCSSIWLATLGLFLGAQHVCSAEAPYAWFRGDRGLQLSGPSVVDWEDSASGAGPRRNLGSIVGRPEPLRVLSPSGTNVVVRLNGSSGVWSAARSFGALSNEFTIVAFLRLHGTNGFLFDGSSSAGMSRALVRDGSWQVDVQPSPIANASRPGTRTIPATPGGWQAHAFVFRASQSGTEARHFVDGKQAATAQLKSPAVLTGLMLGANAATKDSLAVDLAEAAVFKVALDAAEIGKWSADMRSRWGQPQDATDQDFGPVPGPDPGVFHTVLRRRGDDGVSCYRIPGLATSTNGTLLAVFDIRHDNCGDLPGNIDVGLMRSTDDGTTWSPMTRIIDFDAAVPGSRGNGVGDPCIVVDRLTGTIIVAALWSKGGRGWHDSGPGMSPEETGQFVLVRSTDDGLTWSEPINITSQVKKPEWRLCFQGPGAGIQLRDGTLVLPAQFKGADNKPHAFFIFSKDGGDTWVSSGPIQGPDVPETTEAQVAELSDGSILITLRNHAGKGLRAWSRWEWTGELANGSWSPLKYDLEDPVCQASLVRANDDTLIFANPASSTRRVKMSLRFSKDDGKIWSSPRLLDPRPASYSSLAVLRDGSIGVLYECGDANPVETLVFARIPLDWILRPDRKAGLKPAPVFGDNMVLQRDTPLPIWGYASPGASVEVSFAGRVSQTTADQGDSGR